MTKGDKFQLGLVIAIALYFVAQITISIVSKWTV